MSDKRTKGGLDGVMLAPEGEANGVVIWLHGLGADGNDFVPIVQGLGLDPALRIRFIFPHAPMRPVTINGGHVMRAWYDLVDMERSREDTKGILDSEAAVQGVINAQIAQGIPSERIVLAGFSQGGVMALRTGLCSPTPLAGVIALSCYLGMADRLTADRREENRQTAIYMAHGTVDAVVPIALGSESYKMLKGLGHPISWATFQVGHGVHPEEVAEVGAFINRVLA